MQKRFKKEERLKIKKGQALELAIATGKYPAGGMSEVQDEVRQHLSALTRKVEEFDRFLIICTHFSQSYSLTSHYPTHFLHRDTEALELQDTYTKWIETLVTGFYAFMPQGRIGAILDLKVK